MSYNWADLPEELLYLILSNLFDNDRITFGLVCRSWNKLCRHSPCLMLYHNDKSKPAWKFVQLDGSYSAGFSLLDDVHVCYSRYGWLLLSRDDQSLFFLDPFNDQKIHHLPKCDYPYVQICFFNEPTSPNCMLVGVANICHGMQVQIGVLNQGDDKWKSYKYSYSNIAQISWIYSAPILDDQYLYCMNSKGVVSTFDMSKLGNQSGWIVGTHCLPVPPSELCYIFGQYLIKLEGEPVLLCVIIVHEHMEVKLKVYRMEWPERNKWEPVEDLFDKALFVGCSTSFALTVTDPAQKWMTNKIFFPMFRKGYSDGIFYSLDTKKCQSYKGNYSKDNFYNSRLMWTTYWIIPTPRFSSATQVKWHTTQEDEPRSILKNSYPYQVRPH